MTTKTTKMSTHLVDLLCYEFERSGEMYGEINKKVLSPELVKYRHLNDGKDLYLHLVVIDEIKKYILKNHCL